MLTRRFLICVVLLVPGVLRADEAEDRAVRAVKKMGDKIWVTRDDQAAGRPVVSVGNRLFFAAHAAECGTMPVVYSPQPG
jgi:hypothetical protein